MNVDSFHQAHQEIFGSHETGFGLTVYTLVRPRIKCGVTQDARARERGDLNKKGLPHIREGLQTADKGLAFAGPL